MKDYQIGAVIFVPTSFRYTGKWACCHQTDMPHECHENGGRIPIPSETEFYKALNEQAKEFPKGTGCQTWEETAAYYEESQEPS